ncbi:MAG: S-layer homology domain-containing protein [Clostridia bacterium]|nr:S-layer homology domain-containing protein [Clostridia bacterium]
MFISGNLISDTEVSSYGCVLDVGGNIQAPNIYFDSDDDSVYVSVRGDVIAYYYEQQGGSVNIAGDLTVGFFQNAQYETPEAWNDSYELLLIDYYSHYNFIELNVGGDITVNTGTNSNSAHQGVINIGYEREGAEADIGYTNEVPIVVNVQGNIEASDEISIYEGSVTAGGAIRTTSSYIPRTIYIYGGNITAASIQSATNLYIGNSEDLYGLNDKILINLTGNMVAAYNITIFGGDINVGGAIETTVTESDTINIYGGYIDTGNIQSATDIYIGDGSDYYETNNDIIINAGSITAAYNLQIYAGIIHAETVYANGLFDIYNDAVLFDAQLEEGATNPKYAGNEIYMERVTISGLIPSALSMITVSSGQEYSKTFSGASDSSGNLVVWLMQSNNYSGSAIYRQTGGPTLTGTASTEMNYVSEIILDDDEYTMTNIPINVPDAVYNSLGDFAPWGTSNPFADYTETYNYTITYFRNGQLYDLDQVGAFVAGDYEVVVTTVPTVIFYGVTGNETESFAAGYDKFTIEPLFISVSADSKSANVGGALPSFTVSLSDNSQYGGDPILAKYREGGINSELFYAQSYGTTASAGSYPIYARADCEAYWDSTPESQPYEDSSNPYNADYAYIQAGYTLTNWFYYSIQFKPLSGTLTVSQNQYQTTSYIINATANMGGSISPAGVSSVDSNASKTYTITPNSGYVISDVLVDGVSVGAVSTYVFPLVSKDHTIVASFAYGDSDCPSKKFSDLDTTLWYHEGVDYVLRNSLFKGITSTIFEPDEAMTRAMFVTVLYRLENKPEIPSGSPFDDVQSGAWYADAVTWAYNHNIVLGFDTDTFAPNEPVSREEMAAIMYRYASYKGYDVSATSTLSAYSDVASISDWALSPMKWSVAKELIVGMSSDKLEPQASSTRAQVAVVFMRFIENVAKTAK